MYINILKALTSSAARKAAELYLAQWFLNVPSCSGISYFFAEWPLVGQGTRVLASWNTLWEVPTRILWDRGTWVKMDARSPDLPDYRC